MAVDLTRTEPTVPTPDGPADAYLVQPAGEPARLGVLLFMDAIGLRPRLREMADRVAGEGYAVLVPNLFFRAGPAPVIPGIVERLQSEDRAEVMTELRPLMWALTPDVAARDTAAYVAALDEALGGERPLAVVGYCLGGALALRAAAQLPGRVIAAASFHGGNLAPADGSGPSAVVDRILGEVYAAHADQDHSMPAEQIERLDRAFAAAGTRATTEVYAGASHGFTMSDMAVYDADAEQRHWAALLDLLRRAG